jgi:hypothetical protein
MSCKMKANFNSPKIDEQKLSEFMLKAIIQSQSNLGLNEIESEFGNQKERFFIDVGYWIVVD